MPFVTVALRTAVVSSAVPSLSDTPDRLARYRSHLEHHHNIVERADPADCPPPRTPFTGAAITGPAEHFPDGARAQLTGSAKAVRGRKITQSGNLSSSMRPNHRGMAARPGGGHRPGRPDRHRRSPAVHGVTFMMCLRFIAAQAGVASGPHAVTLGPCCAGFRVECCSTSRHR